MFVEIVTLHLKGFIGDQKSLIQIRLGGGASHYVTNKPARVSRGQGDEVVKYLI